MSAGIIKVLHGPRRSRTEDHQDGIRLCGQLAQVGIIEDENGNSQLRFTVKYAVCMVTYVSRLTTQSIVLCLIATTLTIYDSRLRQDPSIILSREARIASVKIVLVGTASGDLIDRGPNRQQGQPWLDETSWGREKHG
ncbi:hypothetical protein HD806DRAFT_428004 [Xylariaceae sp. AK1471]|nr:hypothetical protein HD806DRAFT_428004 [Xylariaceae sp. AK1471]